MTRYALLLRGVNVGTKNSLPMAELKKMLDKAGCANVRTYIQSGNAVFDTALGAAALRAKVERVLERFIGRPIAVTLRTRKELEAIVRKNPFSRVAKTPKYLCVTFLSQAPTREEVAPLHAQDFEPELFRVAGKEIYAWHPNGQARSALAAALNKLSLRGAVTTRNWNTVLELLSMLTGE